MLRPANLILRIGEVRLGRLMALIALMQDWIEVEARDADKLHVMPRARVSLRVKTSIPMLTHSGANCSGSAAGVRTDD